MFSNVVIVTGESHLVISQFVSQELSYIALCHTRKNKRTTQDFQPQYISMYRLVKLVMNILVCIAWQDCIKETLKILYEKVAIFQGIDFLLP